MMHPSEVANIKRKAAWDAELSIPVVPPGTLSEAQALAHLDHARSSENAQHAKRGKRATVRLT